MKIKLVFITFVILIQVFSISCSRSRFSTTGRQFKNGHYINVNHPLRNAHVTYSETPAPAKANEQQKEKFNSSTGTYVQESPRKSNPLDTGSSGVHPISMVERNPEPLLANKNSDPVVISEHPGSGKSTTVAYYYPATAPDTVYLQKDSTGRMMAIKIHPEQVVSERKVEGFGVTGMITGIIGLIVAGIPLGVLSTIFGLVSLTKISRHPKRFFGRGFGTAAIILGLVDIVGAVIALALMH